MNPQVLRTVRLGFLVPLAIYGVALLRAPGSGSFLDGIDLAIHESGHLVFAPFGETLGFLGGTLFQLLLPAAFIGYFLRRDDRYAAAVCSWWVAQNCWNISVYIADARAQELPLVGGGEHDWAYLLDRAGWLSHDQTIARGVHLAGVVVFLLALALAYRAALARPPAPLVPPRRSMRLVPRDDDGVIGNRESGRVTRES
jgi:hypothetical protein